ncbi:MAG: AbrB/MazE/SpoVT family DNA-binding domain-containing protein [Oscillospiraceae bacterium]|nr:AbrB/MazE/SpoVT family DNA-binding domain-containing protein [Oscillospiraceae bacterium]
MLTTIQRWGNSQAVRLPKAILDLLLLQENDQVDIVAENDSIVIRKSARKRRAKKSIDERLEAFYKKPLEEILADETLYNPTEYDWGNPMGKEVW